MFGIDLKRGNLLMKKEPPPQEKDYNSLLL
jgi:hypothetical protein